jgi:hypothetical protein
MAEKLKPVWKKKTVFVFHNKQAELFIHVRHDLWIGCKPFDYQLSQWAHHELKQLVVSPTDWTLKGTL